MPSSGVEGVPAGEVATDVTLGTPGVPAGTETAGVLLGAGDSDGEPTGKTLLGLGPTGTDGELAPAGVVSVTGHTVVEMAIVDVVTMVESAGQLVTLAAQLVIVISLVA